MKEQKTADFIKERYPFYDEDLATRDVELNGEQVQELMQSYSDQQNAELRERVKELETQNKRLKIAHYTIVRAYEEYGPLASVSTKQVSENVLKEIGFDPSKETL